MLIRIYIRLYLLGGLKRYTIITSWGYYITKSLVCQMMHRLRRYDVFRFAQKWCCSTTFRDDAMFVQCAVRHTSLGEAVIIGVANIICRRQTSFKKRTFVGRQKCVFCWRRVWDSNSRVQRTNGFQEVYQRIPFQLSSVQFVPKQFPKNLVK